MSVVKMPERRKRSFVSIRRHAWALEPLELYPAFSFEVALRLEWPHCQCTVTHRYVQVFNVFLSCRLRFASAGVSNRGATPSQLCRAVLYIYIADTDTHARTHARTHTVYKGEGSGDRLLTTPLSLQSVWYRVSN